MAIVHQKRRAFAEPPRTIGSDLRPCGCALLSPEELFAENSVNRYREEYCEHGQALRATHLEAMGVLIHYTHMWNSSPSKRRGARLKDDAEYIRLKGLADAANEAWRAHRDDPYDVPL